MPEYGASGVLFTNEKRNTDKAPNYVGNLELDAELVADLQRQLNAGERLAKIRLAAWDRVGKGTGKPFMSLKPSVNNWDGGKTPATPPAPERKAPQPQQVSLDDEIPF